MYIVDENKNFIKLETTFEKCNEDAVYMTILDFSYQKNIDIVCIPLTLCEVSTTSVAEISIENYESIFIPTDFFVLAGDKFFGELELINVMDLIDKNFNIPLVKPLDGYYINWGEIKVNKIHENINYFFPKMRNTQLLAFPVEKKHNPFCIFVGNPNIKQNTIIDISFFME